MGLQTTMYGDRLQIVLLGKTNAGKSSLINEITGQPLAIVSDTKGTTTDPVSEGDGNFAGGAVSSDRHTGTWMMKVSLEENVWRRPRKCCGVRMLQCL